MCLLMKCWHSNHLCVQPIERRPRTFNPLRVPKALQAALPFQSKPKDEAPRGRLSLEQKRAVVLEPSERQLYTLVQQLNTIRNEKVSYNGGVDTGQLESLAPLQSTKCLEQQL